MSVWSTSDAFLSSSVFAERVCCALIGLVIPGDKGVPNGLTQTYYKSFAPRLGIAWSPGATSGFLAKLTGGPGRTSVSMGFGMFYNPIEQLVLEQFSAEPPFGGSSFISAPFLQMPFVDQSGNVFANPFNGILNPPRGQPGPRQVPRRVYVVHSHPCKMRKDQET